MPAGIARECERFIRRVGAAYGKWSIVFCETILGKYSCEKPRAEKSDSRTDEIANQRRHARNATQFAKHCDGGGRLEVMESEIAHRNIERRIVERQCPAIGVHERNR